VSPEPTEPSAAAPAKRTPKARKKRSWAHGRVFQRGHKWWIAYYVREMVDGKKKSVEYREPAGDSEKEARELLVQRLAQRNNGSLISREDRKLTVRGALDAWLQDLVFREKKSAAQMVSHIAIISRYFEDTLAADVTRDVAIRWIQRMIDVDGYSKGSAYARAGYLRTALLLAYKSRRLPFPPVIPIPDPQNARQETFELDQVEALINHLAWPECDIARMAHLTGWRARSELLTLPWTWIDRARNTISLPQSKNGDARQVEMVAGVREIIDRAWKRRQFGFAGGTVNLSPYVFHHEGRPVVYRTFIQRWHKARKAAGIGHRTPHDLRRSMASDKGISHFDIMELGGWRSTAMFKRYRISSPVRTTRVLREL
jgi:integrase